LLPAPSLTLRLAFDVDRPEERGDIRSSKWAGDRSLFLGQIVRPFFRVSHKYWLFGLDMTRMLK